MQNVKALLECKTMITPVDSTVIQLETLALIREVYESEAELTDRFLLISIFENYRTGGGLRLSKFGFELCKEYNLFEFTKIPLTRNYKPSIMYTSLDRICSSPYYSNGKEIFISDAIIITELTFCCDDFEKLFSMHD